MEWPFVIRLEARHIMALEEKLETGVLDVAERLALGKLRFVELAECMAVCCAPAKEPQAWQQALLEYGVLTAANALAQALYGVLHGVTDPPGNYSEGLARSPDIAGAAG